MSIDYFVLYCNETFEAISYYRRNLVAINEYQLFFIVYCNEIVEAISYYKGNPVAINF